MSYLEYIYGTPDSANDDVSKEGFLNSPVWLKTGLEIEDFDWIQENNRAQRAALENVHGHTRRSEIVWRHRLALLQRFGASEQEIAQEWRAHKTNDVMEAAFERGSRNEGLNAIQFAANLIDSLFP